MPSSALRDLARTSTLIVAALAPAIAGPTLALARAEPDGGGGGDRPDVRVAGTCGTGASSSLRLRSRDGVIEMEFVVHSRVTASWNVTVVHERQVAWRGRRRAAAPGRSFSVLYRMTDLSGADIVSARAVGVRGVVCSATATLPA